MFQENISDKLFLFSWWSFAWTFAVLDKIDDKFIKIWTISNISINQSDWIIQYLMNILHKIRNHAWTSTFTPTSLLHHQRKHLKIFSHYYCISICEMTCFRTSEPLAHFISSFYWVHSCLRKGFLATVECKQDERWRSLNQYCQQTLNFKHTLKLSTLVECSKQFMVSLFHWEKFIRRKLRSYFITASRLNRKMRKNLDGWSAKTEARMELDNEILNDNFNKQLNNWNRFQAFILEPLKDLLKDLRKSSVLICVFILRRLPLILWFTYSCLIPSFSS